MTLVDRARRGWQAAMADEPENPLMAYFRANRGRQIHKWTHYLDVYHRHLAPYRGRPITVLEFGVSHGGSAQMWTQYFGPQARIVGVDVNPRCAAFADERVEIVIGDQEDRDFLQDLARRTGPVDVLIEDGGHTMAQQIATFEEFWPHVTDGGVFLIEDLHTSYWPKYGGGYRKPGTFIEYAKNLVDQQHAWHSREKDVFDIDEYTRTIAGMHVYDSVIVFDKKRHERPTQERTGSRTL